MEGLIKEVREAKSIEKKRRRKSTESPQRAKRS